MPAAVNNQERKLDALTGRATVASRTLYAVLLTSAPTAATTMSTMAEITTPGSNGYNRQAVTWSDPSTSGVTPRKTQNVGTISFGPFTSDLAAATHVGFVTTSTGTGGTFAHWIALDTSRDPISGDYIEFADGTVSITA